MSRVLGQGCCYPQGVVSGTIWTIFYRDQILATSNFLGPLGWCPLDPYLTVQCLEVALGLFVYSKA